MRLDLDPRLPTEGSVSRLVTRLFEVLRLIAQANNKRADGYVFAGQVLSANYTMQDGDSALLVNATTGARAITLLSPAAALGKAILVRKTDATANNVTLTPATGLVDGGATLVLTAAAPRAMLISDGTNYFTV